MARITLGDVLRGKNPNTEKALAEASKRRITKEYAAEGKRRRAELSKTGETQAMLKIGKRSGNADPTTKITATKGGAYPSYGKNTDTAKSFRSSFADAKKSGAKTFTWNGKKYNTKVK